MPKNWVCEGGVRHPIEVGEEKFRGDDVIITIYGPVPDYVVGRSTSRRRKKKFDPRCRLLIPTPPCYDVANLLSNSC